MIRAPRGILAGIALGLALSLSAFVPGGARTGAGSDACTAEDLAAAAQPGDLPATRAALAARQPLTILVLGTQSSTDAGLPAGRPAYPAVLEAELRRLLPKAAIGVSVEAHRGETAAALRRRLEDAAAAQPTLVVWQTGSVDAARRLDLADFAEAIADGIDALRGRGIDVILLGPQFSRMSSNLVDADSYGQAMARAAQSYGVPFFDRYALMRSLSEQDRIALNDSAAASRQAGAVLVHGCVGRALAGLVAAARQR